MIILWVVLTAVGILAFSWAVTFALVAVWAYASGRGLLDWLDKLISKGANFLNRMEDAGKRRRERNRLDKDS